MSGVVLAAVVELEDARANGNATVSGVVVTAVAEPV